jgi:hypothetical protein
MGIKAKLTLIGLLPLMMALVYGIALYLGQERLYKLRPARWPMPSKARSTC